LDLSHAIVLSLASDAGSRLAREAQRSLHSLRDGLHSGEDSGLETTWEEICVQVQGGEMSIHWDTYEHVARATCGQLLEKERPVIHWALVWAQVDERSDPIDISRELPLLDEVVQEVFVDHLMPLAGRWSNARIRRYLERCP